MGRKKASVEGSWVMFVAVIIIFLFVMTFVSTKQFFGTTELKKQIDSLSFFERSKSILNTLDKAEFGEITESIQARITVELAEGSPKNSIKIDKKESKITTKIKSGKITSDRIKFVKSAGNPIEIKDGRL